MSATRAAPLLAIQDLRISYRSAGLDNVAVDGVSMSIAEGRAVGIVGESGSGKSTLARALIGLLPQGAASITGGEIVVDGIVVPPQQLHRLRGKVAAMVFQDPLSYLNPLMSAGAQIAESVQRHDSQADVETRVAELMGQVQLASSLAMAYPHELSGGMRQRVLLAIALACRPRLLIADEPTTALDVTTQREILSLLKDLRRQLNMALLLISHDLGVVSTLCDEIHIMLKGHVVEGGSAADIFSEPRHAYSRGLLNAARSLRDDNGRFFTMQAEPARGHATAPVVPPSMEHPVLELRGIFKTFRKRGGGEHRAVRHATLTVHRGETVALVGESGSGKSTLSRIALRLLEPDRGDVLLNGQSLIGVPAARLREARTDMQPVFQDATAAFNPRRTVLQLLAQATRRKPVQMSVEQHAIELLEKVGLRPGALFLGRYPHELSGGQRQRLSIARALAMEPSLIIADEPLSGADVSIRGQILNLFQDLQAERRLAYLFVTHDISLARAFAHRVAVMYHGELVEQGPAAQVLEAPRHKYTQRLLAASIRIDCAESAPPLSSLALEFQ